MSDNFGTFQPQSVGSIKMVVQNAHEADFITTDHGIAFNRTAQPNISILKFFNLSYSPVASCSICGPVFEHTLQSLLYHLLNKHCDLNK